MLTIPERLELDVDGVPITRLAFGFSLYMAQSFRSMGDAIIEAFGEYRHLVGDDKLRFYATDTMSKHSKVTARALDMLDVWFAKDAQPRERYGIEYHDAEQYNGASRHKFKIFGLEEVIPGTQTWASVVHISIDPSWGEERHEELINLCKFLCNIFPFRSGHAGYILTRSRYFPEKAADHARAQAMRYPGLDLPDPIKDCRTVGLDGVRAVGWLTILDDAFVRVLGGLRSFGLCDSLAANGGVIIRAGRKPLLGDVNHMEDVPEYREVFRFVQPLTVHAFERAPYLGLSGRDDGRTLEFLRRLTDE